MKIRIDKGQLHFYSDGDSVGVPVTARWCRPLTGIGGEVSLLNSKKEEVAYIESFEELDSDSSKILQEYLDESYLLINIKSIINAHSEYGRRYFKVDTDRGEIEFLLNYPERHIFRTGEDSLIIRDAVGNRYQIASLSEMDPQSVKFLQHLL